MSYSLPATNIKLFALSAGALLIGTVATACEFKVSTATLENIKICSQVATDNKCTSDNTKLNGVTSKIFLSADLNYAPEGTKVKIDWNYLGGEAGAASKIDTVSLETKDNSNDIFADLTASNKGFPAGKYEVVMTLDTKNSQPIRKEFSIAKS